MKTCPACRKTYEDETMVFCLDDGTILLRETAALDPSATWNLVSPPVTQPGLTVASPQPTVRPTSPSPQSTITSRPEHIQIPSPYAAAPDPSRKSAMPWMFAIALVIGASGILMAWLLSRGRADDAGNKYPLPTPAPSVSAAPSPVPTPRADESRTPKATPSASPRPTAMPTIERPKPMFAVSNNVSFNGSRITYYPRPSFAQCQADCSSNAKCKGFTWVRPGAYNPGDSAMCYLMSAVTARIPHSCCISAVRN